MRISDWSSDVCSSDLKDGPVGEALDVGDVTDDAGLAAGDRAAHSGAGKQGLALLLEVIVAEAGAAAPGLHGFGARLHEVEQAGLAVLGPFDVHRAAIVSLDRRGPLAEFDAVAVVQQILALF